MTFTDNPRVTIEKRIKQVTARRDWLCRYTAISIDYEDGVAVRLYLNLRPKVKIAHKLLDTCNKQLTKLWKDLKSF